MIKEAIRKSNNESNNNIFKLTPEARELSENFSANRGNLPWPVERGAIIQKFGLQPHPVVRTTKIQSNGLVIATTKDAEISALQNIGRVFNPKDGSKSTLQFSIFNNTKAIDPYLWIVK